MSLYHTCLLSILFRLLFKSSTNYYITQSRFHSFYSIWHRHFSFSFHFSHEWIKFMNRFLCVSKLSKKDFHFASVYKCTDFLAFLFIFVSFFFFFVLFAFASAQYRVNNEQIYSLFFLPKPEKRKNLLHKNCARINLNRFIWLCVGIVFIYFTLCNVK